MSAHLTLTSALRRAREVFVERASGGARPAAVCVHGREGDWRVTMSPPEWRGDKRSYYRVTADHVSIVDETRVASWDGARFEARDVARAS